MQEKGVQPRHMAWLRRDAGHEQEALPLDALAAQVERQVLVLRELMELAPQPVE